ncbi:hypothetical protein BDF21DRAFT_402087 [Thamnidium elegans]|nr:hypothetical protein BDF21DRAFT_402087 [Thamnidium elegans]
MRCYDCIARHRLNALKQPEQEEAISEAKSRICTTTKREYLLTTETSSDTAALDNNEDNDDFLGVETSEASSSDTVVMVERINSEDYELAVNFVAKFKEERT